MMPLTTIHCAGRGRNLALPPSAVDGVNALDTTRGLNDDRQLDACAVALIAGTVHDDVGAFFGYETV